MSWLLAQPFAPLLFLVFSRGALGLGGLASDTQHILLFNLLVPHMMPMLSCALVAFLWACGSACSWQARWLAALVNSWLLGMHAESLEFHVFRFLWAGSFWLSGSYSKLMFSVVFACLWWA